MSVRDFRVVVDRPSEAPHVRAMRASVGLHKATLHLLEQGLSTKPTAEEAAKRVTRIMLAQFPQGTTVDVVLDALLETS